MSTILLVLLAVLIAAIQWLGILGRDRAARVSARTPQRIEHRGMRTRKTSLGMGVIMPGFTWATVSTRSLGFWASLRTGLIGLFASEAGGAYFDLAAATAIMKELYDGQLVEDEIYKENPFYTLVKKATNFTGKNFPIPLAYGRSGGRSTTFANAQANQAPTQYGEFMLTRRREYALATLDNETREATADDKGAFVDALTDVVDKAIKTATLAIASGLFRAGTGSIGQVSTTVSISTGVITLADPTSVTQFDLNQVLQANATDGGASPRSALGYVVAVDGIAGTVTVATSGFGGAAATPSGWATSDYLLEQGDNNTKLSGLPAWLNSSAPASTDNFYGVNRSAHRWRLGGGYFNGASEPIEEAFIDAANFGGREGAAPDMAFTNFQSYGNLEKSLGSKVQYTELMAKGSSEAVIAFEGIKVNGPKSKITILPDRNCPQLKAYILTMKHWTLKSLGECPKVLTYDDKNTYFRVTNADAMETRVGTYFNLYTDAPAWSINVDLGS